MAEDNDFDQIVEKIRNAITIPTLGLDNYYGSIYSFGIFNEKDSNGEPTLSPYAGKEDRLWGSKSMKTVKDLYPEAVNLTNWRNISVLQTYYNYFKNNDIPKENRLPLEIQGVSNEVVSQSRSLKAM